MDYDATVIIPSSKLIYLPINLNSPEIESNMETTFAVNDMRWDKFSSSLNTVTDEVLTSDHQIDLHAILFLWMPNCWASNF